MTVAYKGGVLISESVAAAAGGGAVGAGAAPHLSRTIIHSSANIDISVTSALSYDVVDFDPDGNWDVALNTFTVPADGIYEFEFNHSYRLVAGTLFADMKVDLHNTPVIAGGPTTFHVGVEKIKQQVSWVFGNYYLSSKVALGVGDKVTFSTGTLPAGTILMGAPSPVYNIQAAITQLA